MINMPGISIITPTYNSSAHLEECILSVARQTYTQKEHLIIDNLSTDKTLEIIRKYSLLYPHLKVISENDNGIYDAMNKGIAKCSGDWIYFLGSDDTFFDDDVLNDIFGSNNASDSDIIYGNVQWGKEYKVYDGEFTFIKLIEKNICHQSIFFRRTVFSRLGDFDVKYKSLADWAFNIKWFGRSDFNTLYVDRIITLYNPFGFSSIHHDALFYEDQPSLIEEYFPTLFHLLLNRNTQINTLSFAYSKHKQLINELSIANKECNESISSISLINSELKQKIEELNTVIQIKKVESLTKNKKINILEQTINDAIYPNGTGLKKFIQELLNSLKKRSINFNNFLLKFRVKVDSRNNQVEFARQYFDTNWYKNHNPDISESNLDPYVHYFVYGINENRSARYFDFSFYLLNNPDLLGHNINLYQHYLDFGINEGRYAQYFDASLYLRLYKDVAQSKFDPYFHYIHYGKQEGRMVREKDSEILFTDFSLCISHSEELIINDITRDEFHAELYSFYNPNVFLDAFIDPYDHYINYGKYEGRTAIKKGNLLKIDILEEAQHAEGNIAIHLHLFYLDLVDEFIEYLNNMPFSYDLYISVENENGINICKKAFTGLAKKNLLIIEQVQNRGRDIAPMFCTFGSRLKDYDFVAHLHSKKSAYNNGATAGWREYLCRNLFGSEQRIRKIFKLMQGNTPRGIIYPQNFSRLPYQANSWLSNKGMGHYWCTRLGINPVPQGYFDFPAGSMFWAKTDALKPLFDSDITLNDFAEESGQTDGTFAHCLERLLVLTSLKQKYRPAIIQDLQNPSWSAWGFNQYTDRPYQQMLDQFLDPAIKLIAFDIFDTLLCRPLLNAESTKSIVAERLGEIIGKCYLHYRPIAEGNARKSAGRDVGMKDIFIELGNLTPFSHETLDHIRLLEESVEKGSFVIRSGCEDLYNQALATGKPVVLISDMFLPKTVIEESLTANGISGWSKLFLSNEIGLRKDTGELYEYVFSHFGIRPDEMIMVGDNERSDLQIPWDKGSVATHLLRPLEFARGLPRFREIIENNETSGDLNIELTLGLVLLKNFSEITYPKLDVASFLHPTPFNVGYSIIGPLLVGFSQWLIESTRCDRIERLYFLSREGQFIKSIYDIWSEELDDVPQVDYLVLSRRALSVPMIEDFESILNIAKTTYYKNSASNFLLDRFGLELGTDRWAQISNQLPWESNSIIEVHNENIDSLIPLLRLLEPDIFTVKNYEYPGMKQYLDDIGLNKTGRHALVDIGYSATIQNYLNRCVTTPVHGYYMMTHQRSCNVSKKYNVQTRGCFLENVDTNTLPPLMYRYSFELERFLSSNDPQILKYELTQKNNLIAHYRELSQEEIGSFSFRKELQEGTFRYAHDATNIRKKLFPSFKPSCTIAKQLFEAFIVLRSPMEKDMMSNIVLDDYYCGRGIVNS